MGPWVLFWFVQMTDQWYAISSTKAASIQTPCYTEIVFIVSMATVRPGVSSQQIECLMKIRMRAIDLSSSHSFIFSQSPVTCIPFQYTMMVFPGIWISIKKKRRSENDNTPQPLDQWTNSPFIGQQAGNCKSFTLTHYLVDLFSMHRGPRSIPLFIQHHIQLTSLSLQVSWLSHSWDTAISIFLPQKSKVKVMGESKLKVTTWVQHSIDSHPFRSMSIGHPIPEIWLFLNLTLKIQGQGHGWGQSWKSQHGSNILSTHIPVIPCQSAIPFLRYNFFKIWPWKSKVKVMGEVNVESHNMVPIFYRLTSLSFHINRPSHSWDTTFSKFDLENPRIRSWVRSKLKGTKGV